MRSLRRHRILLSICGLAAWIGTAHGAGIPDVERGRALYENHCIVCHGRSVHGRPGRTPPTHAELRQIVVQWQDAERLRWTEQEVADVTAFLERVVYRTVRADTP